jgi:PTS system cellobiose-specific IIB component
MKILLVCAMGMSTSLLKEKMLEAAEEGTKIDAFAYGELEEKIDDYDLVLVGPQLGYRLEKIKKLAAEHGKVADAIDPIAYGRCQGEKVMKQAVDLLQSL